jgi:SAM-dependent methyltransferase
VGLSRSEEALERELAHYDEHHRYWLDFLEYDATPLRRWLINKVLLTWDRQFALLDPALIKDKVVLEAACGHPRVLYYLKSLGAKEAIGVDLSPRFVNRGLACRRTYVYDRQLDCRPEKIQLRFGDINGPVAADLKPDVIACFQSLHHLDLPRFAQTCGRLLRAGGHVIISDPVGDHPLRRLGDIVGRAYGLLSPDEASLAPAKVLGCFAAEGFAPILCRSMNPLAEIYFHLTGMLASFSRRLSFWARLPLAWWRPIENFLERTVIRRWPRLGWRFFLVLEKKADDN